MTEYIQLDVPPTKVDPKNISNQAIPHSLFQLRDSNNFYFIEIQDDIDFKDVVLLKDNDIFTEDDGVFTWIMGTQLNNDLTSNAPPTMCNLENIHLWSKKTNSIQEIRTKHSNIILSSLLNKDIILNSTDEYDRNDALTEGVIDYIIYAGELKKETINRNGIDYCSITINFLSGTYMFDVIDSRNPSDNVKNCVTNILRNLAELERDTMPIVLNVNFDTSGLTFITQQFNMTRELLNRYAYNGVKVYEFPDKKTASKFNNKKLNLAKLEAMLDVYKRTGNEQLIQKTLDEIESIKSLNIEDYRYQLKEIRYGGYKNKSKRKNNKRSIMNKMNKRSKRRTNKRSNKRRNKRSRMSKINKKYNKRNN